jgi:hypothetical protein
MLPSGMNKPWAGSDSYQISGLNTVQGSTVSRYLSTSLPFCVRFNVTVTRRAATLDTEPLAKSYSDWIHTRLFSNHFQYARSWQGYLAIRFRSMIVPKMIAPFYFMNATHCHSNFASIWRPHHACRSHLAQSTLAPVNCVFLASN